MPAVALLPAVTRFNCCCRIMTAAVTYAAKVQPMLPRCPPEKFETVKTSEKPVNSLTLMPVLAGMGAPHDLVSFVRVMDFKAV